ncbi:ABC-three component system protein [Brevibacillus parabrevis]|uniref:ABC-three component system protein n=1 Tax=Brevibacillus parabrevis TaxID=54914 RepID=UPI0028D13457|nr:ABC-three component system protein [Brevibacillus parabrevis]
MDDLSRVFYEFKFKDIIRENTDTQFEDFFSNVMQLKHKDNFMPCRPWGSDGDKKNDGYLIQERHLFAVNGPSSLNQNRMISKLESDFLGAQDYWEDYFDNWSFVHNQSALPPRVNKKMLSLATRHCQIKFSFWGPSELKSIIFSLDERLINQILGPIPSRKSFTYLTFEDIQPVITSISKRANPKIDDMIPVPEDKLLINGFSDPIIELIRTGINRAPLVRQYLNLQPKMNLGDQIAETLKKHYEHLRDNTDLDPDDIYSELVNYVADNDKKNNQIYMVAVHTVLAYFFEQCTIFEGVRA